MSVLRTIAAVSRPCVSFQQSASSGYTHCRISFVTLLKQHKIDTAAAAGEYKSSHSSSQSQCTGFASKDHTCPQGVQGDSNGCANFSLWLDSCRSYGPVDAVSVQGTQAGRQTQAEIQAEQDLLIAEIANEYRVTEMDDRSGVIQGIQGGFSALNAFPTIDSPCPQGVQGEDCIQFKMWLENCYKFGIQDCMHQYQSFRAGRKTLQQIFAEQEYDIFHSYAKLPVLQRRYYSTAAAPKPTAPQDSSETKSVIDKENVMDPKTENEAKETSSSAEAAADVKPLTRRQLLGKAVKEYGSTVIVFHVGISLMSLGFFYTLVSSGIDVVKVMQTIGIGETILQSKLAAGTGTFVVAYAVHKVFAPARIGITLTSTPFIVRYLRRIGFLKAPPTAK